MKLGWAQKVSLTTRNDLCTFQSSAQNSIPPNRTYIFSFILFFHMIINTSLQVGGVMDKNVRSIIHTMSSFKKKRFYYRFKTKIQKTRLAEKEIDGGGVKQLQ